MRDLPEKVGVHLDESTKNEMDRNFVDEIRGMNPSEREEFLTECADYLLRGGKIPSKAKDDKWLRQTLEKMSPGERIVLLQERAYFLSNVDKYTPDYRK